MVTAPVQKSVINEAGIAFSGHTEYLAGATCGAAAGDDAGRRRRCAWRWRPRTCRCATVSAAHQRRCCCRRCGSSTPGCARSGASPAPRIAVCGLNPHAGESGHLGDEEIRRDRTGAGAGARRAASMRSGPCPADTLFVPRNLAGVDAVLAMYHDQGLPVLKHAGFGQAVNVTLGPAGDAHLGRPWHRARPGRHRPRRPRQPRSAARCDAAHSHWRWRPPATPLKLPQRARKRFGQHFLHDPVVIDRIVDAGRPAPRRATGGDRSGPRRADRRAARRRRRARCGGDRPRPVVPSCARRHAGQAGFRLHECDALDVDWRALARRRGRPLRLVGNLPYNISTPLLFAAAAHAGALRDLHFMLQREVVDRIVAAPGSGRLRPPGVMLAPFLQRPSACSTSGPAPSSRRPRCSRRWCA